MALDIIKRQEITEKTARIGARLTRNPTIHELRKIISEDKDSIMYIFSKSSLMRLVINPGLGRTVGHELVHLSVNTSFAAMEKPEYWNMPDKSGWTIGHEAVRSHIEVSKKLLEDDKTELLSIKDNSGLSVGKALYMAHKSHLTELELNKIEDWLKSPNNTINPIKAAQRIEEPITPKEEVIPVVHIPVAQSSESEKATPEIIKVDENEAQRKEIFEELNNLIKKGGVNAVRSSISEDKIFASYLVSNNVGLDIPVTSKGRKVAHYIAAVYPDLAIKLISNHETANITVDSTMWSVAHEAVFYNKEAARYAMDSSSDLWGISDIDGKSVGHVAVKCHEDIAMLTLAHTNSKKLLSVEDDHRRTVAHIGLYWSRFSIGVLEDPELYKMTDDSNKPLILEAVRLHKSSAAKVQRSPNKYLSNLEQQHGKELLHILKAQLILHK